MSAGGEIGGSSEAAAAAAGHRAGPGWAPPTRAGPGPERPAAPDSSGPAGWFGVEIRHFAALRAIAECGSFRRAAESLGFTQSAVSQQIATLERRVQASLVERPRRGSTQVRLTPAGELLLRHGEAILAGMTRAREDLAALLARRADRLRIGTSTDLGSRFVPRALARLRRESPELLVSIARIPGEEALTGALAQGALDLGFYGAQPHEPELVGVEVGAEPYVLLCPAASPEDRPRRLTLRGLAATPVIAPADSGFGRVERELGRRGVRLDVTARSSDFQTTLGLVCAGVGFALVSRSVAEDAGPAFRLLATPEDFPLRRIWLVHDRRHHLAGPAQALVRMLERR
jgi:molybdate transport repressor ModE-like protein